MKRFTLLAVAGASAAVILILGFGYILFAMLTPNALTPGGIEPETAATRNDPNLTVGRGMQAQREAESAAGKSDPVYAQPGGGRRARNIKDTSQPLSISADQRRELFDILDRGSPPKTEKADFELMIGAAVPRQTDLGVLPDTAARLLGGYWNDGVVVVGDSAVIVDDDSRRVVAIIPRS
ncbi:MAG: DUF1236 domain-containing protein [Pseudorhodoplanes sp.]|uniref:DUF1236 domain-containing protein n=1 Tax=Pseudorhodoplanes sp. TaxID=1934341 RepID=UPI003D0DCA14